ncbi:NAD(P)/FAD-dependent oxidoreductase [Marinomonas balearica]|uniref:3-phenylpropionate/trans-cinnamate dioxygenase ferredoxin reductase subunit n=1 Tax=Marinomonas balearica TaxID=491947 RepID=A0A4R6M7R3_9GAMM|nr:FAD-dependent oxidoreductase [Marinomonas balearica]TDO97468.1 3-phenylpropionate/trans-cinnamate dioxygenase ferredoxin reductase subunit [Marinomonas balearica]
MSCIIIGASHAGVQAAVNLRAQGYKDSITLINAESVMPYQRPPLSKAFLQDALPEQRLWLRPEAFYQQKDITLMLSTRVVSINATDNSISLENGNSLNYCKLIIATGASIRRLTIPGSELPQIHYLRDHKDTVGIKEQINNIEKVVVIGGGYIGLEAAASMAKLGKKVTLLINSERPLAKSTCTIVSDFFTKLHKSHGIDIKLNTQAKSIEKAAQGVIVNTSDDDALAADAVIVGIGVTPEQSLAENAGLTVENGVCVNEFMRTSNEDIYAIGDCVSFYHPLYKKQVRIESVQNATDQSKTAASAICNQPTPYNATPWFWSDQFDAKLQIAGLSDGYDDTVIREESENSFAVFYFKAKQLIAVDTMNQPKTFMATRKHLTRLVEVDKQLLADTNVNINHVFNPVTGA